MGDRPTQTGNVIFPASLQKSGPVRLGLAIQGGGNWGALAWGMLDNLLPHLKQQSVEIASILGTSAGALNAAYVAQGWQQALDQGDDPVRSAQWMLAHLWSNVAELASYASPAAQMFNHVRKFLPDGGKGQEAWMQQAMLMAHKTSGARHPLLHMIERDLDFELLQNNDQMRVVVNSTDVHTGRMCLHYGEGLTAEALASSGTLPRLFGHVEVNGGHHIDGGYTGNPPVLEQFKLDLTLTDIIVLRMTPMTLRSDGLSHQVNEIEHREHEMLMNAALERDLRALQCLAEIGHGPRIHVISVGENWPHAVNSKFDNAHTNMHFFEECREHGALQAQKWIAQHGHKLGQLSSYNPSPIIVCNTLPAIKTALTNG